MASITTIQGTDKPSDSRIDINQNFTNLNADKIESNDARTLTNKTIDADNNTLSNIETDNLKNTAKTGNATKLVTGTAGATGNIAEWDAQGNAVDSTVPTSEVVRNVGNETIAGVKTFSSSPVVPTPTTDFQTATKEYVDGIGGSSVTLRAGIATKDLTEASTTQTIAHGLGVTPSTVRLIHTSGKAASTYQSIGVFCATGNTCVYSGERNGTGYEFSSTTEAIILGNINSGSPTTTNQAGVVSVDATNITITWTKNGSPTSTSTFMWEATI